MSYCNHWRSSLLKYCLTNTYTDTGQFWCCLWWSDYKAREEKKRKTQSTFPPLFPEASALAGSVICAKGYRCGEIKQTFISSSYVASCGHSSGAGSDPCPIYMDHNIHVHLCTWKDCAFSNPRRLPAPILILFFLLYWAFTALMTPIQYLA